MAKSGTKNTSNTHVKYNITITTNSQSIANNTSDVTVSVYFWRDNTGYSTYGTGTVYCKINGNTYTASVTPSQKITHDGITLFSTRLTISHNSDGTKKLETSAWIDIPSVVTSSEQSYSEQLPTISRKAEITDIGDYTVEGEHWLKYKKYSDSFSYNLEIYVKAPNQSNSSYTKVHSETNYVSEKHIKYSYDELDKIYNKLAPNITADSYVNTKYTLKTYNSGTLLGESSKVVNGYIKKAIARITVLGDFEVEKEHYLQFKKYSDNFYYNLWITAKKHGAKDSEYQTIMAYQNYTTGKHLQFTNNQIKKIYNIASPDIKTDTYVDVMYHLETFPTSEFKRGTMIGEETKVVKGKIKNAIAIIDSIGTFKIEEEHNVKYTKYSNNFYYNLWITGRKTGTQDSYQTIQAFGDYTSENRIKFNEKNIARAYKMGLPNVNVGTKLDVVYHLETWDKKGGKKLGTSEVTKQEEIKGNMYIKVNGTWKRCVPFVKVNDNWKPCLAHINAKGVWKKSYI